MSVMANNGCGRQQLVRFRDLSTSGKDPDRALCTAEHYKVEVTLSCPLDATRKERVLPEVLHFCAAYLQLLEAAPLPVQLHQHLHQALCGQQAAVAAREPREQQRSAGLLHTDIISRGCRAAVAWALGARGCG